MERVINVQLQSRSKSAIF